MEDFCNVVNQAFLDFFSIFSLGMKTSSGSILQHFLVAINAAIVLTILGFYVSKGSLFVSADALSKATDIIDLFFPISVHIIVILIFLFHQRTFSEISFLVEMFDAKFKKLNPEKFRQIKYSATIWFVAKFFFVHAVGLGVDIFVLIR